MARNTGVLDAYRDTEVPMHKSFSEIEALFERYKVRGTPMHVPEDRETGEPGAIIAMFFAPDEQGHKQAYKYVVPYQYAPGPGNSRSQRANVGTSKEQIARLVYFSLKARFELVAASRGTRTYAQEFTGDLLTDEQTTVYQLLAPRLQQLTAAGVVQSIPIALEYRTGRSNNVR